MVPAGPRPDDRPLSTPIETPTWLRGAVARLEGARELDTLTDALGAASSTAASGTVGSILRGDWLGHALHPLLTDIPIGCWTSANVLDLVGGRRARPAARHLMGLGVLSALPTAAAGLADASSIEAQRDRRTAVVHAAGNAVATSCYFASWRARRRGHHARGVVLGLLGTTIATGAGYLGGHLAAARGVGTGERGLGLDHATRAFV